MAKLLKNMLSGWALAIDGYANPRGYASRRGGFALDQLRLAADYRVLGLDIQKSMKKNNGEQSKPVPATEKRGR